MKKTHIFYGAQNLHHDELGVALIHPTILLKLNIVFKQVLGDKDE
jgi:hypothetical protein